jgi:flagellar hook protein FlgE
MSRAAGSFDVAAARIARTGQSPANAPSPSTSSAAAGNTDGDTVSLSSSMVSLLDARNNFEANTKTAAVSDEMTQTTLDMIG